MEKIDRFIEKNWLVFFTIYLVTVFLDSSTFYMRYSWIDFVSLIMRILTYLVFAYHAVMKIPRYLELLKGKKTPLEWIFIITIVLFFGSLFINFITTRNHRMINLIFILVSAIDIDLEYILKRELNIQMTMTALIIVSTVIGLIYNYHIVRGDMDRASVGFTYPTNLTQVVLFIMLLLFYIKKEKTSYSEIIFLECLNCFTYYVTNTRTEFFLSQIIVILMLMFKAFDIFKVSEYKVVIKRIYSFIFTLFYPIMPLYSFIMVLRYRMGGIYERINSFLSNRLSQTYFNVLAHGIKPFGIDITFQGLGIRETFEGQQVGHTYVDNEYLQMMFKEGYIVAILFVLILVLMLVMLYRLKKYDLIIICSIYLVFGIINPRIITLMYCPILFVIIPTVIEYNKVFTRRKIDEKI